MPSKSIMLVDYENVQDVEIATIPSKYKVIIYVGSNQKTVPIERVAAMQKYGGRIQWEQVAGMGSNALDFYIACYLGQVLVTDKTISCVVLSKDKGFDPLLRHLKGKGLNCRRINSLLELNPKKEQPLLPDTKRAIEQLKKSPKNRPRKPATLLKYLNSHLFKNENEGVSAQIIDQLFAMGKVSETAGVIKYNL